MKKIITIILGVFLLLAITLGIRLVYPCKGEGMGLSWIGKCDRLEMHPDQR